MPLWLTFMFQLLLAVEVPIFRLIITHWSDIGINMCCPLFGPHISGGEAWPGLAMFKESSRQCPVYHGDDSVTGSAVVPASPSEFCCQLIGHLQVGCNIGYVIHIMYVWLCVTCLTCGCCKYKTGKLNFQLGHGSRGAYLVCARVCIRPHGVG